MAINITKVLDEIQTRLDDSTQTDRSLTALIAASNRIDNSGTGVLTYRSTGHLPQYTDSAYYGTIAYVEVDNVFGDSSGRFYYGSSRDSGWIPFTSLQDSDEATITVPSPPVPSSPAFAGDNYGFSMSGGSSPYTQDIDAYPFASDGNSTKVGEFNNPNPTAVWTAMGGGTTTKGYQFGGSPLTPTAAHVYEFTYAAGTPVTSADTGYDFHPSTWRYGHLEMLGNRTEMYIAGGLVSNASTNTIFKFPEASVSTKTDVGNLTVARRLNSSASSSSHGYMVGGFVSPAPGALSNVIDKWSFTSDGDATDVGDLHTANRNNFGNSSAENGYASGNWPNTNQIQKFPFASDANATDAADLHTATSLGGATSSSTHGYIHGGQPGINNIQKFTFSADENATDVGDLSFARRAAAGTHY